MQLESHNLLTPLNIMLRIRLCASCITVAIQVNGSVRELRSVV